MARVAFQLRVAPGKLAEYRRRHAAVWPEMLREIEASGRRNYSIFMREDGLLFGYYECDDPEASNRYLAASPVAARWEAEMSEFFDGLDGRADQDATALTEIFNLDQQLQAAEGKRP
jgi:L-rhamnose mutarotase